MSTKAVGEVRTREKRGHAYPNPPPRHPISRRLERVRAHFGYRSKRKFWQVLCDGHPADDPPISYEAVRNYHYNREPPPSYLALVAEAFPDVRLGWLVAGRGEMLRSDEARRSLPYRALLDRLEGRYRFLRGSPTSTGHAFIDLLLHYQKQMAGGPWLEKLEGGTEQQMALADDLAFLLTLPLRGAWGFRAIYPYGERQEKDAGEEWIQFFGEGGPPPDYDAYFRLMAHVLMAVVKRERSGDSLETWPSSLIPRLRRVAEGLDPEPTEEESRKASQMQLRLDEYLEAHRAG